MKSTVGILVQARMSSTRLPGKVMKRVLDKPLLGYLLERLKRVSAADHIVVATSTEPEDQVIVDYCVQQGVETYRGSLHDVLARFVGAADQLQDEVLVRICADCPLMDPDVVQQGITTFLASDFDYISNFDRNFPRGMEVEVMTRDVLHEAARNAKRPEEREHVTPFIYRHPERFRLGSFAGVQDLSGQRWVVDTSEDFEFVSRILNALYPLNAHFETRDVTALLKQHPDWVKINAHVQQRTLPPVQS